MWKKLAVVGGIAAVAGLGIGGVAMADSNTTPAVAAASQSSDVAAAPAALTSAATPATPKKAKADRAGKRDKVAKRLEKVAHAQWVSKDGKTGTFVTHDAVRGDVTSVTPTSITIKAGDGTTETFVVNGSTKVHVKGDKGAAKTAGSFSKVRVGDQAGVLGTGAGTMTATQVIDRGVVTAHKKAAPAPTTSAPTTS